MARANIKREILIRIYGVFALMCAVGIYIVFSMGRLQTVRAQELREKGDSLDIKYDEIQPIRGNIYADDGSLLVTSVPVYEARMDLTVLSTEDFKAGIDSLSYCLSTIFPDKSKDEWKNELWQARRQRNRYMLIRRKINHNDLATIRRFPLFRLGRYKSGLVTMQRSQRLIPFGQLAFRTIGYYREGLKPVGLEGAFNSYLNGKVGQRLVQRIPGGVWIPIHEENQQNPVDGQDVYTTIDINFQDITQTALHRALVASEAEYGTAVVMETATGHVKAIANLTRDENGDYHESYNYAIGLSYEPGSTFKLASTMALLEHKKATPTTMVDANGGTFNFSGQIMRDSEEGLGLMNLQEAFALSSNVAISRLVKEAYDKDPGQYISFLNDMKLNRPLKLRINGEGYPRVKSPGSADWTRVTLPWMSVGYEVKLTPMQILTMYNAVANGGKMVKPMFVTDVREAGKSIAHFDTEVINQAIAGPATIKQMQKMLESVVEKGTARNIRSNIYKIAGKTGTAQIANGIKGYEGARHQASFAGYFPANAPRYTIVVLISQASKGSYYGGQIAAPVFREIADQIYARDYTAGNALASFTAPALNRIPLATALNQTHLSHITSIYSSYNQMQVQPDVENWVRPQVYNNKVNLYSYKTSGRKTLPDVNGMVLTDALYVLENQGLRVKYKGSGKVRGMTPAPGANISEVSTVELYLSN